MVALNYFGKKLNRYENSEFLRTDPLNTAVRKMTFFSTLYTQLFLG